MKLSKKNKYTDNPRQITEKQFGLLNEHINEFGDLIVDFFGGAGSTMVSAEETGRTAYLIELSENYCAVILERLTALGLEAKRID